MADTPYDQGKAAKASDKPDSANPYEAGSQESLDWLEGYTASEAEPGEAANEP